MGVTGPLGAATAGVEVLKRHKKRFSRWSAPLVKAQNRPLARLKEGRILGKNRGVHAVMDLSDGLDVSLQLMGEASRVGFEINVDQLPIVPSVRRWAGLRYRKYWDYALHGGEDYELMFTVEPRAWKALQKQLPRARIIGEVKRKAFGIQERAGSEIAPLQVKSFEHFA